MRLFAALWPSPEAVAVLVQELAEAGPDWPPEGWRAIAPARWHLTLCFYGEDADPGICARRLEAGLAGRAAPRLRLSGAGFFPRLAYAGVTAAGPDDETALAELVAGAGGELDGYEPHVTVARSRRGRAWPPADSPLHRHRGPWWHAGEARLVHSSLTPAPPRYRIMHRVPLGD